MVASVLAGQEEQSSLNELLRPEPLSGGLEPEQRVVFCGISWGRYLDFDSKLGHDRPGPRLFYLGGEIEIVTTSNEHERIKKWLMGILEIYFDAGGVDLTPRGQATMRLALKQAGAEPDESWCIGQEREFPDLILEVALTSGGVNKLEIYRHFQVPEVWFWRTDKLEIFALSGAGQYERLPKSRLLPGLDIPLLERCVRIRSWKQARQMFSSGLAKSEG